MRPYGGCEPANRSDSRSMALQDYSVVRTRDGTQTLHSLRYGEAMHSVSGAYQESLLKHVNASGILSKTKESLHVLDIGFGIGFNTLALIVGFLEKKTSSHLSVISLESLFDFLPLLDLIAFGDERDRSFELIKKTMREGSYTSPRLSITLLCGDARETIRSIRDIAFDAVFHDPFSPAKNPELWSVEFFSEMRRLVDPQGVITTYSSAPQIRSAFLEAGFLIGRGPSVGPKREGTLASVCGDISFLSSEELASLRENHRAVPYRDPLLCDSRERILERRLMEIRARKGPPVPR